MTTDTFPPPFPLTGAARRRMTPSMRRATSARARHRELRDDFSSTLAAARHGRPWAFEALFTAHAKPLQAWFRSQGAADPDGSVNEVLLRAFRGIERFEGTEGQFRSWVFTIARNLLIDERRRALRRVVTEPLDDTGQHDCTDRPDVDECAEGALDLLARERVLALLDALSPDQRDVLLLRVVADLTIEQIADVVGKRVGAVKALQRRGLAAVRRHLEREGHRAIL